MVFVDQAETSTFASMREKLKGKVAIPVSACLSL